MFSDSDIDRLREAWQASGYHRYGQIEAYGGRAIADAARRDYRGILDRADSSPLGIWTALFTVGLEVPRADAHTALQPLPLETALEAGMLEHGDDDMVRAGWGLQFDRDNRAIFSDQAPNMQGARRSDHVLGLGGATKLLGDITIRRPVESALEIGTGCGVHALSLASHSQNVTATDISERALQFAALNARLNGIDVEFLLGDMFQPVADRSFDLITANPPFVIATPGAGWTYRDAGRDGDGLGAELAAIARTKLRPGGIMQYLANWLEVKGEKSEDRVASWFPDQGVRVWAVEREQLDPLDYVRTWQRDSGGNPTPQETAEWLNWFKDHKVEGIGFGFITIEAIDGPSDVVCDGVSHSVESPWSERILERLTERATLTSMEPEGLLDAKLEVKPGVKLQQEANLGDEGWDVEKQSLRNTKGLRYSDEIDPLMVTLLASCTGTVPLRLQIELLGQQFDGEPEVIFAGLYPQIRRLIDRGYLQLH